MFRMSSANKVQSLGCVFLREKERKKKYFLCFSVLYGYRLKYVKTKERYAVVQQRLKALKQMFDEFLRGNRHAYYALLFFT